MIGLRMTIVDVDGKTVSLNSQGDPTSIDMTWFNIQELVRNNKYYFTNSKFENPTTYFKAGGINITTRPNKIVSISEVEKSITYQIDNLNSKSYGNIVDNILDIVDAADGIKGKYIDTINELKLGIEKERLRKFKTIIKYMTVNSGNYVGQGDKFKSWMLGDLEKISDIGGSIAPPPSSNSGGSSGSGGGSTNKPNNGGSTNKPNKKPAASTKKRNYKSEIQAACADAKRTYKPSGISQNRITTGVAKTGKIQSLFEMFNN